MVVLFPFALAMLAQTAATPAPPAAPAPSDSCADQPADSNTIVICTQRPQGYRLNPDVMEAKRESRSAGRPVRPGGHPPPECATVGPFPCLQGGMNLIGAALTAVEMAKRAATGQDVGKMFLTDPHPDEYQLYLMAKARREAAETEKKAKAKAAAAQAAAAAASQQPGN